MSRMGKSTGTDIRFVVAGGRVGRGIEERGVITNRDGVSLWGAKNLKLDWGENCVIL